jgi:hypothetical protein
LLGAPSVGTGDLESRRLIEALFLSYFTAFLWVKPLDRNTNVKKNSFTHSDRITFRSVCWDIFFLDESTLLCNELERDILADFFSWQVLTCFCSKFVQNLEKKKAIQKIV